MKTVQRLTLAVTYAALFATPILSAQPYPSRPVTIIVPFPPGGGTDVGARLVARKLQEKWNQGVVVDNKGGAAGMVGSDVAAKTKPDGYTLLVGNVGTVAINQSLYKKMPYDANTAFAPVGMIADLPLVLLTNAALPFNSVNDLINHAKANPEKITYASSGAGGAPHLAAEIFTAMTGTKLTHVPYKGGGPAVADLIAGHVNILFATVLEASAHVKGGRLKAVAVTSKSRSPALPDVPTVHESGVAGYESGSWIGMLAPTGTPKDIVDKLSSELQDILNQADVKKSLTEQGALPRPTTAAQFSHIINTDRDRYAKIIRDRNITTE